MECRICFEDDNNETLFSPCKCSPCKCSGSMKWIHNSCLQKWIHTKKNSICPVCKEEYIMKKTKKTKIISFLVQSNLITTVITAFLGLLFLLLSFRWNISMNTVAITCLIVIFGIHYIQEYFEHEEIDMENILNSLALYTSRSHFQTGDGLTIIFSCLWLTVDHMKYKILSSYL